MIDATPTDPIAKSLKSRSHYGKSASFIRFKDVEDEFVPVSLPNPLWGRYYATCGMPAVSRRLLCSNVLVEIPHVTIRARLKLASNLNEQ